VGPYSEGALEVKRTPFLSAGALDGVAALGAGGGGGEGGGGAEKKGGGVHDVQQ
jgi:hypothetical protein